MFPVLRVVKAGIWGFWFLILAIPSRTWQRCPSRAQHPRRLVKWWECCVRLLRPSNVSSTKSWLLVESSLPIKRPLCIRSYHPKGCLKLSNPTPCPLSEDHENTVSWEWEQCIHKGPFIFLCQIISIECPTNFECTLVSYHLKLILSFNFEIFLELIYRWSCFQYGDPTPPIGVHIKFKAKAI